MAAQKGQQEPSSRGTNIDTVVMGAVAGFSEREPTKSYLCLGKIPEASVWMMARREQYWRQEVTQEEMKRLN